jgi:hypothetical protein
MVCYTLWPAPSGFTRRCVDGATSFCHGSSVGDRVGTRRGRPARSPERFPCSRGSVVVDRRVLDAEEVVQDRPDVAMTVVGLAQPDVQDDHASWLSDGLRRLHRERQPVAAVEVDATHDWLERPGEPVRSDLGSARIATELCVYPLVAGSLAGQAIDELAHRSRRDHLVVRHAGSCVSPQVRTRRWAPRRRVPGWRARGVQDRRVS